ncbi:hypothetical protein [Sideroxydans sp. CL21]|nr:hypothetical protein [Sideroxydans sp. CL21]
MLRVKEFKNMQPIRRKITITVAAEKTKLMPYSRTVWQ